MGSKIGGIILVIVAAGLLVFVSRTGVLNKANLPSFSLSRPSSSPQGVTGLSFVSGATSSQTFAFPFFSSSPPSPFPAVSTSEIPSGFTREQLSPWFHKVRLYVSPGNTGYITLSAYLSDASATVPVSGWLAQSRRTKSGKYIPRAVRLYDAQGIAPEESILMRSGQVVRVSFSDTSPIGVNFLTNECLGYLAAVQQRLDMSRSCPTPTRDELDAFGVGGYCQNYIRSLGSCGESREGDILPTNDEACLAYLKTLNYRGCVQKYRDNQYFFGYEWRTWSAGNPFDVYHDRVLLFDTNGLVVDEYSY